MKGRFLTLEGGEGVGKSTQAQFLLEYLTAQGKSVVLTREPGGSEVGESIRRVLLDKTLPDMHADTELMLMFAARVEHVQKVIKPALTAGKWVISDRFTDASFVYQGAGRGLSSARIRELADWALQGFRPDMTILLDAPVNIGLRRVNARGQKDRFEQQGVEFFERIRDAYLALAAAEPERFVRVDASEEIDQVAKNIRSVLSQWLEQR